MTKKKEREEELAKQWKRLLNYQSIIRQIPFFLFMTAFAVIYIYNGHMADKTMRKINSSERQLKELQNEYKTIKGEALLRTRQSEITEAVKSLGLTKPATEPIILIDSFANR